MFKYFKNFGDKYFMPLFDDEKKDFVNYEIDLHEFAFFFKKYHYVLFSCSYNVVNPSLFPGLVSDMYFQLNDIEVNVADFEVPVYLIVKVYENGK